MPQVIADFFGEQVKGKLPAAPIFARAGDEAFAIDGRTVFVGSFNLDPRSARLNTEMGVYVESPATAQLVGSVFDRSALLWSVQLDPQAELTWTPSDCKENCDAETSEPEASFWQKANAQAARILHLDSLL